MDVMFEGRRGEGSSQRAGRGRAREEERAF